MCTAQCSVKRARQDINTARDLRRQIYCVMSLRRVSTSVRSPWHTEETCELFDVMRARHYIHTAHEKTGVQYNVMSWSWESTYIYSQSSWHEESDTVSCQKCKTIHTHCSWHKNKMSCIMSGRGWCNSYVCFFIMNTFTYYNTCRSAVASCWRCCSQMLCAIQYYSYWTMSNMNVHMWITHRGRKLYVVNIRKLHCIEDYTNSLSQHSLGEDKLKTEQCNQEDEENIEENSKRRLHRKLLFESVSFLGAGGGVWGRRTQIFFLRGSSIHSFANSSILWRRYFAFLST